MMNTSHRPPNLAFPPSMGPLDTQTSPTLSINLGSNNPFRNRTLSPSATATTSGGRPDRPLSTNPFLDDVDAISPQSAPGGVVMSPTKSKPDYTRELFENLSLDSSSQPNGYRPAPPRPEKPSQRIPSGSRPPRERSERREKDGLDIFADPPNLSKTVSNSATRERGQRRPQRRNSESSIMERPKLIDDDDRRRRERRHRERDERRKDGKEGRSRSKKANYRLDIIDKLDVTSIYGTGMFHHDGPFDACNPHRNRKGVRAAPMQAFPKDSSNMALGGSGPVNSNIDLNLFHGRMEEGYNDFATSAVPDSRKGDTSSFDPTARIEPVHGSESMGLGTSTFLEGAPASRSAMQRRESENDVQIAQNGGLQRKKSLAQRLRGINNRSGSGRMISPEPTYMATSSSSHSGTIRANEKNPFFQDYDDAWDKKGAKIQLAEETRSSADGGRVRSSSSPKQNTGVERRFTDERSNTGLEESKPSGGGFINRMKSLRKPRPERRTSND